MYQHSFKTVDRVVPKHFGRVARLARIILIPAVMLGQLLACGIVCLPVCVLESSPQGSIIAGILWCTQIFCVAIAFCVSTLLIISFRECAGRGKIEYDQFAVAFGLFLWILIGIIYIVRLMQPLFRA